MNEEKKFDELVRLWEADKKLYVKKSTHAAYSFLIKRHLLPAFHGMTDIQQEDVQKFVLDKLEEGVSRKYIKDMLIVLKMILKFGAKNNMTTYKPIEIMFPTDREKKETEVLSKSNQRTVMEFVTNNINYLNLGIYICLTAGLRIGEVCALKWEDIDIDNGLIKVNKTLQRIYIPSNINSHTELIMDSPKSRNSIRDIPMTRELVKLLRPIKKAADQSWFLLSNSASPTEPHLYRNYYKKLMKQLNIPPLKFHGLRHSFATRCIESNCDYKTVSVLLGHSNISTTLNLYVHPNMEQKKRCVEQMAKALK